MVSGGGGGGCTRSRLHKSCYVKVDQKSGNSWNAGTYNVVILHSNNGPVTTVAHVYCGELVMCSGNVMFHDVTLMHWTGIDPEYELLWRWLWAVFTPGENGACWVIRQWHSVTELRTQTVIKTWNVGQSKLPLPYKASCHWIRKSIDFSYMYSFLCAVINFLQRAFFCMSFRPTW
jgi:hypothetical protein